MSRTGGVAGFAALKAILKQDCISDADKIVSIRLAIYQGNDDDCYPRQQTLADACGMRLRTVQRSISRLKKCGVLITRGQGRATRYSLNKNHAIFDGVFGEATASSAASNPAKSDAKLYRGKPKQRSASPDDLVDLDHLFRMEKSHARQRNPKKIQQECEGLRRAYEAG